MIEDDWLLLDAQLCFRLYAASRALTQCYQPLLAELDLTYPQYLVMLVLWQRDGLLVKDISQRLRLDSSTVTPLLRRLESAGWITRQRRPENEREVAITLTDSGRALKDRARQLPPAILQATGLQLEQVQQLRTLLDQLLAALDRNSEPAG